MKSVRPVAGPAEEGEGGATVAEATAAAVGEAGVATEEEVGAEVTVVTEEGAIAVTAVVIVVVNAEAGGATETSPPLTH